MFFPPRCGGECTVSVQGMRCITAGCRRESGGGFAAPTFLCPKEKSPRPVEKKCFCFGFEPGGPLVALRLRFARGRSVGGRGSVRFYRQPLRLTPAPIAARPVQRPPSETTAPSTATLRQQGVAEGLLVLACPLVASAHNAHRMRAARHKPPTPITPPANPTPAFAGRWDRKRPISPAGVFSSTVHGAFSFGKTKENGGCISSRQVCRHPAVIHRIPAAFRRSPSAGTAEQLFLHLCSTHARFSQILSARTA